MMSMHSFPRWIVPDRPLPESEVACVRSSFREQYQPFLASNLTRGFGDQLHECFAGQ